MRPTTNPKGQVGPPEPILPPILTFPEMSKRTSGPKLAIFNPWPLEATRGHQLKSSKPSLHSGEGLSFTNELFTKDSGMVHIWYNIPLCTNFAQKSNGDVLRTKMCHSSSSPQIHQPFLKEVFSIIQS
ncbi:hypothetical protein O181_005504 [Austropuccinia psidii MF-1]|uniref:Uncharacterized protein n=1 Tax=Austropuccinia psidii MF-1 TaxID=1389203 RepID=A0A9Q3GFY3_9BASI|nr:hypothetical protein [Austropuccinia psidii MF-1]